MNSCIGVVHGWVTLSNCTEDLLMSMMQQNMRSQTFTCNMMNDSLVFQNDQEAQRRLLDDTGRWHELSQGHDGETPLEWAECQEQR